MKKFRVLHETCINFNGLATIVWGNHYEDLNDHLLNFLELCGSIKMNGEDHDVIKLKLFPFSLRDKARSWFHNLMSGSINRWEELVEVILAKFFSPQLMSQLREKNHTI